MNALEYLGLGLLGLLVAATLLLSQRVYRGVLLWSWAWLMQILTGFAFSADGSLDVVGSILATLFPLLQLAGTLDYLNRPLPAWLIALGVVVMAAKAVTTDR